MTSVARIDGWDLTAVAAYFASVLAVSLYSMMRSDRSTTEGYFLAGRFMTWVPVGASLFASNIGSEHFIGLAGSGAATGIGVGAFELNAALLLQLLGWVFLPVYIASHANTLPEYMNKRFGGGGGRRIQLYLACLSLVLYIFTKISVNLYSGALFIQVAVGWSIWSSVLPLLVVSAFVALTGGLAAVIYTDTLQCLLMVVGGGVVSAAAFLRVGGMSGLHARYFSAGSAAFLAGNGTCNLPSPQAFTMLRGVSDPDMPWLGFLLGQTPASIWYWCADQMMVQRALAARSLSHAQGATLLAGVIKFTPLFFLVMPGMVARVLFPDEVACSTREECLAACGSPASCTNIAYPRLVMELMPSGLRGGMLAVMLAALMSDLTSIFNSASTLFTLDIYPRLRPRLLRLPAAAAATEAELMVVGRAFVLFMLAVSVAWVPMIHGMQGGQLYIYIQTVAADLSPPVAAVYSTAVLWPRANEQGAFWGLMVGLVVGSTRMVLEMVFRAAPCGEEENVASLAAQLVHSVHYMYFALFLFLLTIAVIVCVSLASHPPPAHCIARTTFWTRWAAEEEPGEEELQLRSAHNDETGGGGGGGGGALDGNDGDSKVVMVRGASCITWAWRLARWLCGMQPAIAAAADHKPPPRVQGGLLQDPRAKVLLTAVLVVVVAADVACYIFFSLFLSYFYPNPAN